MATINKSVYLNGMTSTFKKEEEGEASPKLFAIALTNSSGGVIATSAFIKLKNVETLANYLLNTLTVSTTDASLACASLDFTQTISLLTGENSDNANGFAIYSFNGAITETGHTAGEAYTGAGTSYFWPLPADFNDTNTVKLISGALTTSLPVAASYNFKFESITVSFSEVQQ